MAGAGRPKSVPPGLSFLSRIYEGAVGFSAGSKPA